MTIRGTLYPETPIWNRLASDNVNPDALLASLHSVGIVPVISIQLISELAATFSSTRSSKPMVVAQRLFAYLHKYVLRGIPCLKTHSQLLFDEALKITGETEGFNVLLSEADYKNMETEVEKLARGLVESSTRSFLRDRRHLQDESRSEAAEFGRERSALRSLCETSFGAYLNSVKPIEVLRVLVGHLRDEFPTTSPGTLLQVAAALLRNPNFRVANAMVRADLYTTWRAIRSGALSRDVLDDCFHLVNASYCDFYATADRAQAQYAPLVLRSTGVLFHDGATDLVEWLTRVTTSQSA